MPNYFTQRGLERHRQLIARLEARLSELEALVGGTAETGGGWHDNAGLDHLNYDIRVADSRLNDAYALLRDVEIIRYHPKIDRVVIGCEVSFLRDGKEESYQIIAYGESDVDDNKMLYAAPVAQSLMGHRKGDAFCTTIAGKMVHIQIMNVLPLKESED